MSSHPWGRGTGRQRSPLCESPALRPANHQEPPCRKLGPWPELHLLAPKSWPEKPPTLSCAELATTVADRRKTREIPKIRCPDGSENGAKPQAFASIWGRQQILLVCARFHDFNLSVNNIRVLTRAKVQSNSVSPSLHKAFGLSRSLRVRRGFVAGISGPHSRRRRSVPSC